MSTAVTGDLSGVSVLATTVTVLASVTASLSPLVVALGGVMKLATCLPVVGNVVVGVLTIL